MVVATTVSPVLSVFSNRRPQDAHADTFAKGATAGINDQAGHIAVGLRPREQLLSFTVRLASLSLSFQRVPEQGLLIRTHACRCKFSKLLLPDRLVWLLSIAFWAVMHNPKAAVTLPIKRIEVPCEPDSFVSQVSTTTVEKRECSSMTIWSKVARLRSTEPALQHHSLSLSFSRNAYRWAGRFSVICKAYK